MYRKPFSEPLHDVYMPLLFREASKFSPRIKNTNVISASESDRLHFKKILEAIFISFDKNFPYNFFCQLLL